METAGVQGEWPGESPSASLKTFIRVSSYWLLILKSEVYRFSFIASYSRPPYRPHQHRYAVERQHTDTRAPVLVVALGPHCRARADVHRG